MNITLFKGEHDTIIENVKNSESNLFKVAVVNDLGIVFVTPLVVSPHGARVSYAQDFKNKKKRISTPFYTENKSKFLS